MAALSGITVTRKAVLGNVMLIALLHYSYLFINLFYYYFFGSAVLGLQVFCKLKVVNLKCLSKSVGLLYKERRGMQMHLSVNT